MDNVLIVRIPVTTVEGMSDDELQENAADYLGAVISAAEQAHADSPAGYWLSAPTVWTEKNFALDLAEMLTNP